MPARRRVATVAATMLGLVGALAVSAPASALPPTVIPVTDPSGDATVIGSLAWAVGEAELDPDHNEILLQPTAGPVIALDDGLVITTDVTITGPGVTNLTVSLAPAASATTVFDVTGSGPVTISGMTIAPTAGVTDNGIHSDADSLTLTALALNGFDDDNISIEGSVVASDIVTTDSEHDGFSFFSFTGGTADLSDVTSNGNGDYGFVLGSSGAIDASGLTADGNGGGILAISFGSTLTLETSTAGGNAADGVRLVASSATVAATGITSTGNGTGASCGCGGSGIAVDADSDSSVTISSASVSDNTATEGAGIFLSSVSSGSSVAISDSTVSGNRASAGGGGLAVQSLSGVGSSISISDTTISGNDAGTDGGGINLYDLGAGDATGPVIITRTTIDGNTAGYGGGVLLDGSAGTAAGDPAVTISASTISNNIASEEGGGLYLFHDSSGPDSAMLLTGTTVSGNEARGATSSGNGGAIYVDSAGSAAAFLLRLEYSTIAANDPPGVGGVYVDGDAVDLRLLSSILAGNERGDLSVSPTIANIVSAWSLVQSPAPGIALGPSTLTGADPQLGALADNGGPTKTMLVTPGSAAYNAGDPSVSGAGLTDQRGEGRVYQRIDIGAVEWHPALAVTGTELTPGPPLVALLLLSSGLAMIAFSRLRMTRSVG